MTFVLPAQNTEALLGMLELVDRTYPETGYYALLQPRYSVSLSIPQILQTEMAWITTITFNAPRLIKYYMGTRAPLRPLASGFSGNISRLLKKCTPLSSRGNIPNVSIPNASVPNASIHEINDSIVRITAIIHKATMYALCLHEEKIIDRIHLMNCDVPFSHTILKHSGAVESQKDVVPFYDDKPAVMGCSVSRRQAIVGDPEAEAYGEVSLSILDNREYLCRLSKIVYP